MRVEIDVELPECIAAEWEVVAVRKARAGDFVPLATLNGITVIEMASKIAGLHAILRRKDNPKEWWPKSITADRMTFFNDVILLTSHNAQSIRVQYDSSLIDLSKIPGHLRSSGRVIDNPWKVKVQR